MKKILLTVALFVIPNLASAEIKINSRVFYDTGKSEEKLDSFVQNDLVIKTSANNSNFAATRNATISIAKKMVDTFKEKSSTCAYTVVGVYENKKLGTLTPIYTPPSNYGSAENVVAVKAGNARFELYNSCSATPNTAIITKTVYQSFETRTIATSNYDQASSTNYCYGVFGKRIVGDGSCSKNYADYLQTFESSIQAMLESAIIDAEKQNK